MDDVENKIDSLHRQLISSESNLVTMQGYMSTLQEKADETRAYFEAEYQELVKESSSRQTTLEESITDLEAKIESISAEHEWLQMRCCIFVAEHLQRSVLWRSQIHQTFCWPRHNY